MRLIESRHGFQFDDDACADNQVYTLTRYGDAPILNGHRALPVQTAAPRIQFYAERLLIDSFKKPGAQGHVNQPWCSSC